LSSLHSPIASVLKKWKELKQSISIGHVPELKNIGGMTSEAKFIGLRGLKTSTVRREFFPRWVQRTGLLEEGS
jgi:hypothetical protein